ncbi:phosphatase PAP2 family protein [Clostridium neuense]|uniref:Phosphatase PAP2 family protein n=1 Tax=Clostridium neuense TaxID=1728934 RepID=A0ABW8TAL0_9CLOT
MNKGKDIKNSLFYLSFMLILPLLHIIYKFLNAPHGKIHNLSTIFDECLPFVKVFIVPYITWYVFTYIILIYIYFKNRKIYLRAVITYIVCLIISYFIFYFFQTTVPRPELIGNDIFTNIIRLIYKFDKPFNCFPSIHVISCYIIIKSIKTLKIHKKYTKPLIYFISMLIILSTLLIKQHVLLDILCAILLVETVIRPVFKFDWERFIAWKKKQFLLWMMKKKLET